jgi:hypothetical protein
LVRLRTQVKNQLQALALNQGMQRKWLLWSVTGRNTSTVQQTESQEPHPRKAQGCGTQIRPVFMVHWRYRSGHSSGFTLWTRSVHALDNTRAIARASARLQSILIMVRILRKTIFEHY